jgi:septal ring factor EnvC (AmiA/AmiB activator)
LRAGLGVTLALALGVAATAASRDRGRLERLNLEESTLAVQQGRNLNQLSRLLSVLLRLKRDPPPALLVSPTDARRAVRAAILVRAMTPELLERAENYSVDANEIARQRRLAAVQSEALFTSESARAEGLRGKSSLDVDDPLEADRGLAGVRRGDSLAMQGLRAPGDGRVVHKFGAPVAGGGRARGLTIQTTLGASVQAPASAEVQYVGPVKGWGVILILKMNGGYHLVLAGLDRATVQPGQSVAAGAPVGWMPDGRQSRSELYFEVREQGVPVDPARWMRMRAG